MKSLWVSASASASAYWPRPRSSRAASQVVSSPQGCQVGALVDVDARHHQVAVGQHIGVARGGHGLQEHGVRLDDAAVAAAPEDAG
jgi:hypothetical protein